MSDALETGVGESRKAAWDIQEIVAMGLLLCLGILLVGGIGAAIAGSTGGDLDQISWQQFVVHASEWAGPFTGFVLIAILGLTWWQVEGWTERLSELDEAEDSSDEVEDVEIFEAVAHVDWNRTIGAWLLVSCVVVAVATVALTIGEVSQFSGNGQTSLLAQQAFLEGGQSLAALLLAAIGAFGTLRFRRTCDKALSTTVSPHLATGS